MPEGGGYSQSFLIKACRALLAARVDSVRVTGSRGAGD